MHIKKFIPVLTVIATLIIGPAAFAQDSEPTIATSSVYRFGDASEVEGASAQLTYFEEGVTLAVSTNDLNAGDVYTVWWVVFNAPENCSDGVCNEDDIFVVEDGAILRDEAGNRVLNMEGIQAANISVQHTSGSYSIDGTLYASASLAEGEAPGIVFGPGLLDVETAEIHMVVRTHGPAVDEAFVEQLSTFGGGCEPMDAAPCDDVQFAVFPPLS